MVERLVRNRGSIGRRIWRRRRRKTSADGPAGPGRTDTAGAGTSPATAPTSAPAGGGAHAPAGASSARAADAALDHGRTHNPFEPDDATAAPDGEGPDGGGLSPPARGATGAHRRPGGLFAALKALLGPPAKRAPAPPAQPTLDDVARAVLAVPRGIARLDAFERAIAATAPDAPSFRALALAFHKELRSLADSAGVELSLLEQRVTVCAQALVVAGESERAGELLLRVGRRHQAAELFVSAGAIDALEETYAQISWDEGGLRLDAKLAFERFESLYLVHLRDGALLALERAHALWQDNPVYAEVRAAFLARLGVAGRVALASGDTAVRVVGRWPIVVGRGEDATLRLASPLLSRAHVQLERDGEQIVVVDLDGRGGTRVGGIDVRGRVALPTGDTELDMGGVVVQVRRRHGGLWLWPALSPAQRTVAVLDIARGASIDADDERGLRVNFDERGRARVMPPALLRDDALSQSTLLLEGDRVAPPDARARWTVLKG